MSDDERCAREERGETSMAQLPIDCPWVFLDNWIMSIDTTTTAEAKREVDEAVERLLKGVRDPDAARRACERMDREREELRKKIGTIEVAVDLIRDARNP